MTCDLRLPRGERKLPRAIVSADEIAPHLEDAAHFRGGRAACLYRPDSEAEVAEVLRQHGAVLPIGAQSSLTGGATPFGEALVSTARLRSIGPISTDRVTVGAGVTLVELETALEAAGRLYPPLPTFTGATAGGVAATNAAGAATFKYGSTREWIHGLTVVLASGAVIDIERGTCRAPAGRFTLGPPGRPLQIPVPSYRMPSVAKLSAGYFARPDMDLVDLFVGSEGTLGVVTALTLRLLSVVPASCLLFVCFDRQEDAYACATQLRDAAREAWRSAGGAGIDVSAIEHMDARCLQLLREWGIGRREHVAIPETAATALLVAIELDPATTASVAYDVIGGWNRGVGPATPLARLCAILDEYGVLERAEPALPGDRARAAQLRRVREEVPMQVNQRVKEASLTTDPRIEKVAADIAVPFEQLLDFERFIAGEFRARRLDGAVWGHMSDGNLHPNVMARSAAELERGREAMLAIGREAIRRGGTPLAEHGVGRNRVKQQLLLELYGAPAIEEMRQVKRALDPEWKLAPGVIFAR